MAGKEKTMDQLGRRMWAVPGGHIPLRSTGREPEYNSHERICILNAGQEEADVRLTLFYADRDPIGPYPLKVKPRRVRQIRLNDLIDPQAMPLDTDYACVLESSVPVIVQFIRMDTSQAENALFGTMAFPLDGACHEG